MARRFTETAKWRDVWFRKLKPLHKLVFLYLCDDCDCAGFWEIDIERATFEIGIDDRDVIEAIDSLGEKMVRNGKYLWVENFLKHQRNVPLNSENKSHVGIIARLERFRGLSEKIDILLNSGNPYEMPDEAPTEPLSRGYGNGKGKGNGKGGKSTREGDALATEFEGWWSGDDSEPPYPRRVSKKYAKQKYISARKNGATIEELAVGKRNFALECEAVKREEQFISYASTWLNQERWKDYQEITSLTKNPSGKVRPQAATGGGENYQLCVKGAPSDN